MNKIKKLILALTGAGIVMAAGNTAIPSDISTESVATAYNASKQVKGKYRLENAKMVREAKANPKDRLEIEIGDDGENFKPKVKVERWDDEVNFSLELLDGEKGNTKLETENDKIKWSKGNKTARFYEIDPSEQYPEGGYEFDIELKKKPKTNKIEFSLNTKGVEFFYQPELTQKEKDEGASRPDNVVGSYAVYASENKPNLIYPIDKNKYTQEELNQMVLDGTHIGKKDKNGNVQYFRLGKEYKVGKIGHIYRPKIYDATGASVWGILSIDKEKGILTVEIPQEFLDKAVYPVLVDPTFGYTSIGGTTNYFGEDTIRVNQYTAPTSGTITKLTLAAAYSTTGSTSYFRPVVYSGANALITYGGEVGFINHPGYWQDLSLSEASIIGSANYRIGVWIKNVSGYPNLCYDTGLTLYKDNETYSQTGSPPSTFSEDSTTDVMLSIYATYTEGGGETSRRIIITQ